MIVYRIESDTITNGKRVMRVVKIERDPRRRRTDVLLGEAVFWDEPYTIERGKRLING